MRRGSLLYVTVRRHLDQAVIALGKKLQHSKSEYLGRIHGMENKPSTTAWPRRIYAEKVG